MFWLEDVFSAWKIHVGLIDVLIVISLSDPRNWTPNQVCQFINWLIDELNIKDVDASQFRMNGVELCNLSKQDLTNHFPVNLVDILWMYLETLKFGMFKMIY